MHVIGSETGDYAWMEAWKVEVMMWILEPGKE